MTHQANDFTKMELKTHPGPETTYQSDAGRAMDQSTDVIMMGFQTSDAEQLTGVKFYSQYLSGTSPYYKFQLWPLSTVNLREPDITGTVLAETAAFQCAASTAYSVDFTSAYTATQGEALAVMMVYSSGTIDGSNNVTIKHTGGRSEDWAMPFSNYGWNGGASGSWTSSNYDRNPNFAVTTNKLHDEGFFCTNVKYPQFILDADGDRVTNRLVMPTQDKPMFWYVNGFHYYGLGPSSGDEAIAGIWSTDGTLLAGVTWDAEWAYNYPDTVSRHYTIKFTDTAELASGGTYYIGWQRVTDFFQVHTLIVSPLGSGDEAEALTYYRSWPMGADCRMFVWDSTDTTPAWKIHTDTPYCRMLLDPIIEDMHGQAAAGGGGSTISGPSIGVIG